MHRLEGSIWRFGLRGRGDFDPYRHLLTAPEVETAFASLVGTLPVDALEGSWIVVQLPAWRPLACRIREAFGGAILFDCLDDFAAFSEHSDMRDEELLLARQADLVVTTAQPLHDRLAPVSRRCALIRNGCDPEHFAPVVARPRPAGPVTVGYFGGIHDWFDAEIVNGLAQARPDWHFLLVGDTYHGEVAALAALPNVALIGEVPYAELPGVVSAFDVGIIPFKINALTLATNPVKVYEMLAAGLPVVGVDLPELRALAPYVTVAGSVADFERAIEAALATSGAERERRARFAAQHAWSRRFMEFRQAMDQAPGPRSAPGDRSETPGPWNDDGSRAQHWATPEDRLHESLGSLAVPRAELARTRTSTRSSSSATASSTKPADCRPTSFRSSNNGIASSARRRGFKPSSSASKACGWPSRRPRRNGQQTAAGGVGTRPRPTATSPTASFPGRSESRTRPGHRSRTRPP